MKNYKYLFSVVIPVYNTEPYLEEMIESVVNQTIGFENIQLILINDASTDKSGEICLTYKNRYPDNIVVDELRDNTGGCNTPRHIGFKYIEGRYTYSCDSDDKLSLDMFEQVYNFFLNNSVSIVLIPAEYFGAWSGVILKHYEYWETEVKDVVTEDECMRLDYCSIFFSSELFEKLEIYNSPYNDYGIRLFIGYLLLSERYFGYISTVRYYYRKRFDKSSHSDSYRLSELEGSYNTKLAAIDVGLEHLEEETKLSLALYGFVVPYIKRMFYWIIDMNICKLQFDTTYRYYKEAFYKIDVFLKLAMSFEGLLDDKSIINNFERYIALFLLNWKYKSLGDKNNKINIKNLIKKGILKDNIEEYCFLSYEKVYVNEFRELILKFIIITPIDVDVERVIGKINNFEQEATVNDKFIVQIWDEVCFKKDDYILKIDVNKLIGQELKFLINIDKINYEFSGIFKFQ